MDISTELDPDTGILDRRRLFSERAIWTYGFVGMAILCAAMTLLWSRSGIMVETWSGGRIVLVLVAALYGLGLGWMVFPRIGRG